jgi:hypothetical protein
MQINKGDIIVFHGTALISRLVRFFSTTGGEHATRVNHIAVAATTDEIHQVQIIEALTHVDLHGLWEQYAGKGDRIAIFRKRNLTDAEAVAIVKKAATYIGDSYGYLKIVMHLLDWCIGGRYFFRRLTHNDKFPICSWVVAAAYSEIGEHFDCEVAQAEPDDIWDYCLSHMDKYEMILPLVQLKD